MTQKGAVPILFVEEAWNRNLLKMVVSCAVDLQQMEVCTPLQPSRRAANFFFVHSRLLLRVMKDVTAETIGTFFLLVVGNLVNAADFLLSMKYVTTNFCVTKMSDV